MRRLLSCRRASAFHALSTWFSSAGSK
uniref:Uncharacterized protein n=1 Tax=Arundo donax TaxID=35708 RepID=A0A0A9F0A8_ARUDO